MRLNDLLPGHKARVESFEGATAELETKLREVGFSEGDEVEMLTYGPFGGRTLAVRLNRSIIALRGGEAAVIHVQELT